MGFGQYDGLGEYCGPHTASEVFLILVILHDDMSSFLPGRSLIWVAILGLIMLYVYALLGFAFFRASFEPGQQLYCNTLYECSVTIIRYGMIGDIDEVCVLIFGDFILNKCLRHLDLLHLLYIICKYTQKNTEINLWHFSWRPHVCTLYQIMYALTSFRE